MPVSAIIYYNLIGAPKPERRLLSYRYKKKRFSGNMTAPKRTQLQRQTNAHSIGAEEYSSKDGRF